MSDVIRIGSRSSALAMWQSRYIRDRLLALDASLKIEIIEFQTRGDTIIDQPLPKIGGKGLFTAELEAALREERIDMAVHSLKDLPVENPPGLILGAIPERIHPADVLVSRHGLGLDALPENSVIGTSSLRRAAQIHYQRDDLQITDIRGNIDTRVRKALDPDGPYDAIVLAHAGLARLDQMSVVTDIFNWRQMMPAPGQGALAVQCREKANILHFLRQIDHPETAYAVTAERYFLAGLGGGCSLPVGAYAHLIKGHLYVQGNVTAIDGSQQIHVKTSGSVKQAADLGNRMAQDAMQQGAAKLISATK